MSRRRSSGWRVPPFVGLSVLGHVLLYLVLSSSGVGRGCMHAPGGGAELPPVASLGGSANATTPDELDLACLAEKLLAAGARAAWCLLPVVGDDRACMSDAAVTFAELRAACRIERPIEITMIEPEVLNPFAERPDPAKEQEELEQKLEEERKKQDQRDAPGQVVEIAPPAVELAPDDARYVSEYDSRVERETRGPTGKPVGTREPAPTPPQAKPNPEARPQPPSTAPPAPGSKGPGALAMRGRTGTGTGQGPEKRVPGGSPEGREVTEDGIGEKRGEGDVAGGEGPAEPRGGGDGNPLPRMEDLRPSQDTIARAVGGGSSDHLPDVDEGAETLLNTKRWRYASFFNRVKRAVAQNWHPDVAYSLRDPTGQIYGTKPRLTILKVVLRPDGTIRDLFVQKPCGVDFLDDEAVRAFREAQPFPNPPAGLVNPDSQLITFTFGFYFVIEERSSWKIFRYSN